MTKSTSTESAARVRVPPPLVFLAAIVAGALLPGLRLRAHFWPRMIIGALLLAGCLRLGAGALKLFRKTGQDPAPWKPTPELVFDGPYKFTRNPMYVGMLLAVLGIAALSGRGWMVLFAPLALLAVHFTAVVREEEYLSAKFGQPYDDYRARVRRYF